VPDCSGLVAQPVSSIIMAVAALISDFVISILSSDVIKK